MQKSVSKLSAEGTQASLTDFLYHVPRQVTERATSARKARTASARRTRVTEEIGVCTSVTKQFH